jgi:hypothetical protein
LKPLTLLGGLLLLLLTACSGGDDAPGATATLNPDATATTIPYVSRLSDVVRQQAEAASWYNRGDYTAAGANLLDVIVTGGPLWRDEQSLALLAAYPNGIDDESLATARTYARMTLTSLHEVILNPWLVDGLDDYERAILAAAAERPISIAALRRAIADGFFRDAYATNPETLTSLRIDAIGSLSPHILDLLETQEWFSDGIDSYEASLLGVLNTLLSVDEQIRLLQSDSHKPLPLRNGSIAAVYLGDDPALVEKAHSVAAAWMEKLEAFVGEFRPVGLVIDTTPIPDSEACHTGDGGGSRPGRIALPSEFCYQTPVLIHELAHAFIGGRYPTWFAEGVAELVSFHFTGTRAGYVGGEGTIELEGRYFVLSPPYRNQAALGADFLEALYSLAGPEETSAFLADVAGRSMNGADLLARVRDMQVDDRVQLEDLIADSFGLVLASP